MIMNNYPAEFWAAGGGNPAGDQSLAYTGGMPAGGGGGDIYTPPAGYNNQSMQNNQGVQNMANASLMGNQTLNPQVLGAAQQGYQQSNAEMMNLNTPQVRQQYLDQTNLGAVSQNYSDLASKLASYDNMVLKPQFAGTNPGKPTDLPNNPDVYMGNVSYLTPQSAALPYQQGIFNANPSYALNAQADQQNSILDLLNSLNSVIGKERDRGTNKYTSDLKSVAAAFAGFSDILDKNAALEMKKAELAAAKAAKPEEKLRLVQAELDRVRGADGYVAPSDYQRIRQQFSSIVDPADFDNQFSDYRNPQQSLLFPSDTYKLSDKYRKSIGDLMTPTAQEKLVRDTQDAQDKLGQIQAARSALAKSGSGGQYFGSDYRAMLPGGLGIGEDASNTKALFSKINEQLFKVAGTAFTGSEKALLSGELLSLERNPDSNKAALDLAEKVLTRVTLRNQLRMSGYDDNEIEKMLTQQGLGLSDQGAKTTSSGFTITEVK